MTTIIINEKEYKARLDFKFERLANEKYSEKAEGKEINGFMAIYLSLLQYNTSYLAKFWDCALAHYKKDKPTLDDIEEALFEKIESDGDQELFEQAFQALDRAGFFKRLAQKIRKELLSKQELPIPENETEEEKKEREKQQTQQDQVAEELQKAYKELTGSDTTKE